MMVDHAKYATLGYAGVIWLLFLIWHLYLIDVWLGENQRTPLQIYIEKRLDYIFKFQ